MTKTKTDRIASVEDKIKQLENQRRRLLQQHREQERKARTRRLVQRGAILEGFIPDPVDYTNEQIQAALKETIGSDFGRKALRRARHPQNGNADPARPQPLRQGAAAPSPTTKTETAQKQAASPASSGRDGGTREGG